MGTPAATTIDEIEGTEEIDETDGTEQEGEGGFALAQPYAVPSDSAFQGREFIIDPDDLAQMRKGGMANGGVQGHGHKRSDAHAVAHGAKEFLLWVAADISREGPLTRHEIEAAVYHEMCHLGYNENTDEVKIVDEPVKYCPSEKRRYGLADPLAEGDSEDGDGPLLDALAEMDDEDADADGDEG